MARLDITTRERGGGAAFRIAVDAGRKGAVTPASRPAGTTVEVRDLFAATPARLKFLKSDRAEAQAVGDVLRRLAMAHPAVHFELSGTPAVRLDCPGCAADDEGRLTRIAQIIGSDFLDNALKLDAEREGVRLGGFIGLPTFSPRDARQPVSFRQWPPGARQAALGRHLGRLHGPCAA